MVRTRSLPGGTEEKPLKTVRTADVPIEIRTECLPTTTLVATLDQPVLENYNATYNSPSRKNDDASKIILYDSLLTVQSANESPELHFVIASRNYTTYTGCESIAEVACTSGACPNWNYTS